MARSSGSPTLPRSALDRERFLRLYDENVHRILGYALRRTDEASAQDVVAETFLVAWRRLEDVPAGAETRLWLYGVARRVLSNQRRGELRKARLRSALELDQLVARRADASDRPGEANPAYARAFGRLRPKDREVLGLLAWETLDYSELAAVLRCSVNAAKIRVHRARRRFALELSRQGVETEPADAPGHAQNVRAVKAMEETT